MKNILREYIKLIVEAVDTETVIKTLDSLGYSNIKKMSSRRIAVLIDGSASDRLAALQKITDALESDGAVWDQSPSSVSSIGMVKVGNMSILAKPAKRQGGKSAGLGNESILVDKINETISNFGLGAEGLNVEFVGAGAGKFLVQNVTSAVGAGAETAGRKKSDVNLISVDGITPISIKKDNAQYWESADSYYGQRAADKIEQLISAGEIEMVDRGGYYNIVPNIAIAASPEETEAVVFGSDLLGSGAVIKRTFRDSDFSYDENKNLLTIQATYIITDLSHVTGEYEVWFLVRNDRTRKSVPGYPGIRVLAAYQKRINKNVKRVE